MSDDRVVIDGQDLTPYFQQIRVTLPKGTEWLVDGEWLSNPTPEQTNLILGLPSDDVSTLEEIVPDG